MRFTLLVATLLLGSRVYAGVCEDRFAEVLARIKIVPEGNVLSSEADYPAALQAFQMLPTGPTSLPDLKADFAANYPKLLHMENSCPTVRLKLAKVLMAEAGTHPEHRAEIAAAVRDDLVKAKRPVHLEVAIDGLIFELALKQNLLSLAAADVDQVGKWRTESRSQNYQYVLELNRHPEFLKIMQEAQDAGALEAGLRECSDLKGVQDFIVGDRERLRVLESGFRGLAVKSEIPRG